MILKKLPLWSLAVFLTILASNTSAETCPDFNQMTFKTLAAYNKYKNTVKPCYIMPEISEKTAHFPITFHSTQSIDISTHASLTKHPPFAGDKVICHVSWQDKNRVVPAQVILNEKVKTTSKDWHYANKHKASCTAPSLAKHCCTFSQ